MVNLAAEVLTADAVRLGRTAVDKNDAVSQCGALLVEIGAVEPPYQAAMHEREASMPTYIGEGVAIPHGTDESRRHVLRTALGVLQFPAGVDWDGNEVTVCIAIAADGDQHIRLLSALAVVLLDPAKAARLRNADDVDTVLELLTKDEETAA
ncbi:MAG TPA: PTS sugar transporter subunit IIA [Pseudonocardiaceae bacterium]|nr:PTS sugar transporter subunit IIA [Pseudonocardiaceae bacterium]